MNRKGINLNMNIFSLSPIDISLEIQVSTIINHVGILGIYVESCNFNSSFPHYQHGQVIRRRHILNKLQQ